MASNQAKSLARVTVAAAGSPIQITVNETTPADRVPAHSILFERDDPNDTGLIYIGRSVNMVRATLVDVIAILPAPSSGVLPSITITLTPGMNSLNAADFFIDADVSGDSILASFLEG